MHDGLIYLHEGLQDGTITSGLQVDDMVQKFGLDPDVGGDINVMAALAAAFTMAAGASAAAAPISGPLTVVAGVFSLVRQAPNASPPNIPFPNKTTDKTQASLFTPSPTDPTAAVSVQLSDAFKAAEHSVEQTAALIFGSKQNAGSWMDLPEQIGDYRDAMARFIAEGRFIGVNMNDRLKEISTEWTRRQVSCYDLF